MASTSSSSPTTGGPSPLANIITQVPQSANTFASSAAARPVKIKKKKQQDSAPNKPRKSIPTTTAITTPSVAPTTDTTAQNATTTTPLTPAEAAAQAAANMQAKQQQQQQALAPPRTTSKQQPRKPSSTATATATAATRSTSASTTTTTTAAAAPTTATPAATSTPTAAPTPAPPTTRSQAYTTTAPKEKAATPKPSLTPAEAAAKAKSATTATQNKPKFMRRFIAIITCSSPSHMVSPSDDSARTLTGGNASSSTKKSYEAGTASTLDGPATTAKSPATAAAPATAAKEINEKSTLKPPSAALQPPTTPTKSSTLSVPATNGHLTPSSSSSSALLASGANAPPSPSPSTIAGGTRLPREETGDVTSGAVVPPGASYVHSGTAGPGNMFRLASAVDGVPSLGIIAAVAGTGKDEAGLGVPITPGATPRQSLLATPEVAAAAAAATASAAAGGSEQSEELETEDEDEMDDEEDEDDGAHLDEDEYELSEEALEEQRLIAQGGNGIPVDEDGNPQPLLSPIIEKDSGRKCLVLDLDETLVHSSFKMIHNADFIVPVEIEGHSHSVYVIKRPGVDEFMRRMGELYEVVVFTASLSKYADPVLDMLDIHRVVRHRLFRESCFNHKGNYVKDLSQLGRPIGETLILDNSPASYIFHPNNAVPISSWFNDPHDTELVDLCEFLRDLSVVDDVRTVLDGAL
ncbi:hypothetical protein CF319_g6045 [Tilletia indica]|nr:hypothetical protein CF319_g6045 [Tilletia indica]